MTLPFGRVFSCAMVLLAASCSAQGPGGTAPVDAGSDIVDTKPEDAFIGTGNLVLAWTVRGEPPETGCAAAGAVSVRFPANFVQFPQDTTVPCTQGRYEINNTNASQAAITAELLDAAGTVLHTYVAEATVMAGQTTTTDVRFEAPGSLRVQWTINGASPANVCGMVGAMGVQVEVQRVRSPMSRTCSGNSVTFRNLQVGATRVTGVLVSTMSRSLQQVMGSADVPSGGTGTVDLAFEAPVLPDH